MGRTGCSLAVGSPLVLHQLLRVDQALPRTRCGLDGGSPSRPELGEVSTDLVRQNGEPVLFSLTIAVSLVRQGRANGLPVHGVLSCHAVRTGYYLWLGDAAAQDGGPQ